MPKEKALELASKFAKQGQMQLARRLTLKAIKADEDRIEQLKSAPVTQGVLDELTELYNLYKGVNDDRSVSA